MLNYLLLYGFLYSLLSLIFPSKKQEDIIIDIDLKDYEIIDIEVEEDSEIEIDIQI